MSRVVVDTNVYVSAIVFGGTPKLVLDLVHLRGGVLLVSPFILAEVEKVLDRKFRWEAHSIAEHRRLLWSDAGLLQPFTEVTACRDPKDNHILALAVDGAADVIVTGDDDLLVLNPFREIAILNPRDYIGIQRRGASSGWGGGS